MLQPQHAIAAPCQLGIVRDDDHGGTVLLCQLVKLYREGEPVKMSKRSGSFVTLADVVREVGEFFSGQLVELFNEGVAVEQVALDAGIGFGKTLEHNLQLLAGLRTFTKWQRPLVLGVSRKSFIQKLLGADVENRLPASLACTVLALAGGGMHIVRTHDVAETAQAVRMAEAVLALKNHHHVD